MPSLNCAALVYLGSCDCWPSLRRVAGVDPKLTRHLVSLPLVNKLTISLSTRFQWRSLLAYDLIAFNLLLRHQFHRDFIESPAIFGHATQSMVRLAKAFLDCASSLRLGATSPSLSNAHGPSSTACVNTVEWSASVAQHRPHSVALAYSRGGSHLDTLCLFLSQVVQSLSCF